MNIAREVHWTDWLNPEIELSKHGLELLARFATNVTGVFRAEI